MSRPRYLQDDEEVLLVQRRRLLSVIDELVGITLLMSVPIVGGTIALRLLAPWMWRPWGILAIAALSVLAAWWMFIAWRRAATSVYTVTDTRVYKEYGRFRWHLLQTTFDKVTDLHLRQGVFGRMFGYGTVRLATAGTGLVLNGIPDPVRAKGRLEDARSLFLRTILGEEAPSPEKPVARHGMGAEVWRGAPSPVSLLGRFLTGGAMVVAGLLMSGILAASDGGPPALVGLALVAFGLASIGAAAVALRYTRYHVHEGGVIVTSGWLTKQRIETTYAKVTDVQTTQGILGRIFGFGVIRINTAGSNDAPVVFLGVVEPEDVKRQIDSLRGAT